jgi:3-hydroxy-9,10-secoandrosta-1,3,5(10)-triene-9,17-dione monooxygenase reductase component
MSDLEVAAQMRAVLGHYPTGVTLISALGADGGPLGLTVGTFTSISLDPPLVGFFVGHSSTTWPLMQEAGRFCANVLADDQPETAMLMASKDPDKHRRLAWRTTDTGHVRLDGCVGWIECDLHSVVAVGDHDLVVGAVRSLEVSTETSPLLFLRGGFRGVGRYASVVSGETSAEEGLDWSPLAPMAAVWA